MKFYSGHLSITLETLTLVFASPAIEPSERVEMWRAVEQQITEMVAAEWFAYADQRFVREYHFDKDDGSLLIQYEDAANAAVDRIWRFKNLLQVIGVREFLKLCRTLNGGDAEEIEALKQFYDPERIYFPTTEKLVELYPEIDISKLVWI